MASQFAFPVLIGDVGGTNARFAQVPGPNEPAERFPYVRTKDYATFSEAMRAAAAGSDRPPRSAVVALAGPVAGDAIELTNAPWVVEPRKTIERLDLEKMCVINDFEAQSLALPVLGEADLVHLGTGDLAEATKVVVGPGTGLGAGALVRTADTWVPVPGEGGHMDLGPMTDHDAEIWAHIEDDDGRVSGETLLSGHGMVRLYRAVCAARGFPPIHPTPADITESGLIGRDPRAAETLNLFAIYLGRIAGDLALVFLARGGVYLAGGITARIASVLAGGGFREAFSTKPPHGDLMDEIATVVVTASDAALRGLENFVRAPEAFAMDLRHRTWTRG